ncbi:MAG: Rrf2 family transcriptional regulator [Chitinophagaceae bacterium]|nr:Rrf2 family transcriptional regulator [Chitinophagaceae bacterium]
MFSKAAEYALRATFYVAQKGSEGNKLPIENIARAIGSPKPFTAKILQILTKEKRIISSVRGPNGGFYIKDSARELPLLSVLEAMGEDHTITNCILGLPKCSSENPCPLHYKYEKVKADLISIFSTITIGDIAKSLEKQNLFLRYFPNQKEK